jgi:DNA-binding transcriptional MerR regulator
MIRPAVVDTLTIGELAARTGVAAGTLRMWESRHGFPRPRRSSSGHRRYSSADATLVEQVLRHRAAGLSLAAAIERAQGWTPTPDRSIFAALRRRRPDLPVQRLGHPVMLAMSRAIEDECLARASHGVLAGSFQRPRHFHAAAHRWHALAATVDTAFVLAEFDRSSPRSRPARLAVAAGDPAAREWAVVCFADDLRVCLAGWEMPRATARSQRLFEAIWTMDPDAVATALGAACALARQAAPRLAAEVDERLERDRDATSPAERTRSAECLVNRMLGHLGAAAGPAVEDGDIRTGSGLPDQRCG